MSSIFEPLYFAEARRYPTLPFSVEELNALLRARAIEWTGSGYEFRMVGVASLGRQIIYVLPKYVQNVEADEAAGQRYVKILKRYMLSGAKRTPASSKTDDIPLLVQTFEELNSYFIKCGLFKERRNVDIVSQQKKTNWSKTITKNEVIFSNYQDRTGPQSSVLYYNPVSSITGTYEGQVSRLYKVVLSLLASVLSPILRINHPLENKRSITQIVEEMSKISLRSHYFRRILQAHIAAEAGARKRVLKVLYKFLSSDTEGIARIYGDKLFVFGTLNFELVWEDACLSVLGASRSPETLAQPRFFPLATTEVGLEVTNQRADGFIFSEEIDNGPLVTIVDAKYYAETDRTPSIRLSSADVMKQFGYEVSTRGGVTRDKVRNVFLLPSTSERHANMSIGSIGLARGCDRVAAVNPIEVFRLDAERVFDAYLRRDVDNELIDLVVRGIPITTQRTKSPPQGGLPPQTPDAFISLKKDFRMICGNKAVLVGFGRDGLPFLKPGTSALRSKDLSAFDRRIKRYRLSPGDESLAVKFLTDTTHGDWGYAIGNSFLLSKKYDLEHTVDAAFIRSLLDTSMATEPTVWQDASGVRFAVEESKYTVEGQKAEFVEVPSSLFEDDSYALNRLPDDCDQLADNILFTQARRSLSLEKIVETLGKNDFKQAEPDSPVFYINNSPPICLAEMSRDHDEECRLKVMIPDRAFSLSPSMNLQIVIYSLTGPQFFIVEASALRDHFKTAKRVKERSGVYYKFFIRGLNEGTPALFSRAAERRAVVNLLERTHKRSLKPEQNKALTTIV